jgi:hypothetical protein
MPTTFQKRQKEMKRLEKQKMKEERRAQKKLEGADKSNNPDSQIEELQVLTEPLRLDLDDY